jgi:ATP-dependent RNA helicase HrpB
LAILAVDNKNAIPWSKEQRALLGRIGFLRAAGDERFPDFTEIGADELAPFLLGRTALADIAAADLDGYLASRLPHALRAEIDRALPTHFLAPTGSRLPIDYGAEAGPTLEIRVQELFGLDRHPTIAAGRVPLVVVLLSPAHRPIQTTRDLPGFWRGSWKDVAKEMKGRYPRHRWPEEPWAEKPSLKTKNAFQNSRD